MGKPEYRAFEAVNAAGLPTFVGACKLTETPRLRSQETLRWLVANVTLEESAARRFAANRVAQIRLLEALLEPTVRPR